MSRRVADRRDVRGGGRGGLELARSSTRERLGNGLVFALVASQGGCAVEPRDHPLPDVACACEGARTAGSFGSIHGLNQVRFPWHASVPRSCDLAVRPVRLVSLADQSGIGDGGRRGAIGRCCIGVGVQSRVFLKIEDDPRL